MANWYVAGTHSDIYVERAYIFRDICIQKYVYSGMFGYVQRAYIHIYIYIYIYSEVSRDIQPSIRIKYSRHTKCAAGMLILVIIDTRDMVV